RVLPEQTTASVNGQSFKIGEDFIAAAYAGQASGRIVYVGHGHVIKAKDINPYQGVDVKDKIILAVEGAPRSINRDTRGKKEGEDYDNPETYARAHGAKGVIYIPSSSTLTFWQNRYKSFLNPSRLTPEKSRQGAAHVPTIYASEKMVRAILQGEKLDYDAIKKRMSEGALGEAIELSPGKRVNFNVNAKIETAITQNVVGI